MGSLVDTGKALRNALQDNTINPYSNTTNVNYSSSTKYVIFFGKKSDSDVKSNKYNVDRPNPLPIVVLIDLVEDTPEGSHDGSLSTYEVNIRCIANMNAKYTFNTASMKAEEICQAKLEEIRQKMFTNTTLKTALGVVKMFPIGSKGRIIPLPPENNDYAYVYTQRFQRNNEVTYS